MKKIITKKYAQIVHDDGYADGGEPYTDDEMNLMEPEMVEMNSRPVAMPRQIKSKLQNGVYTILEPTYFSKIPLGDIFDLFAANNVIPVQEDGTRWDGFLVGGGECGSRDAEKQRANIELAIQTESGPRLTTASLSISWCKMPSGKMEVIGYIF